MKINTNTISFPTRTKPPPLPLHFFSHLTLTRTLQQSRLSVVTVLNPTHVSFPVRYPFSNTYTHTHLHFLSQSHSPQGFSDQLFQQTPLRTIVTVLPYSHPHLFTPPLRGSPLFLSHPNASAIKSLSKRPWKKSSLSSIPHTGTKSFPT